MDCLTCKRHNNRYAMEWKIDRDNDIRQQPFSNTFHGIVLTFKVIKTWTRQHDIERTKWTKQWGTLWFLWFWFQQNYVDLDIWSFDWVFIQKTVERFVYSISIKYFITHFQQSTVLFQLCNKFNNVITVITKYFSNITRVWRKQVTLYHD